MKPIYIFWPQGRKGEPPDYTLLTVYPEQREAFTFIRKLDGSIESGETSETYEQVLQNFSAANILLLNLPPYGWKWGAHSSSSHTP